MEVDWKEAVKEGFKRKKIWIVYLITLAILCMIAETKFIKTFYPVI